MQSEFYNVALDRIRYSLVWEDSETLYQGLQLQPEDKVLVITSAGCNVLNCLLKNPAKVTAIDLNPVQNQLLRLKKYLILHFEHNVLSALLGLEKPETVAKTWQKVAPEMPADLAAVRYVFRRSQFKQRPRSETIQICAGIWRRGVLPAAERSGIQRFGQG